jgi:CubicO group peptidase (beta-lactamase class C family)
MLSRSTLACIGILAVTTFRSAQQTPPVMPDDLPPGMQLVIRDLDRTASEAVTHPNDIGYTLGVVTRKGLAWTNSYGYADSGHQVRASSETLYGIGCDEFTSVSDRPSHLEWHTGNSRY